MTREEAENRALFLKKVREFFSVKGYLEVDTPVVVPFPIPESSIELFRTEQLDPVNSASEVEAQPLYLLPSPEVEMKRLLSKEWGSLFQICHAFRNSEPNSPIHAREFTMLEWYGVGLNYFDNMALTEELFKTLKDQSVDPAITKPFLRLSMEEAFSEYAGFRLSEAEDFEQLKEEAEKLSITVADNETWADLFHKIFLTYVEESLPDNQPLILYNYPSKVATLSQKVEGTLWSQRWELYFKGVELANCFTEASTPDQVSHFFQKEGAEKAKCRTPHPVDPHYPAIFETFPDCSGVAMGIDRLLMAFWKKKHIKDVLLI